MPIRRAFFAALAVTAALVVGAPAADASTFPFPVGTIPTSAASGLNLGGTVAAGPCGRSTGGEGQGDTAGTENEVCQGSGLSFVGPSIGQVASIMGPTIIGPAVVGTSVVSAGAVSVGY